MKTFTTIFNVTVAIFMLTLVSITAYERYDKKDNTKTYTKDMKKLCRAVAVASIKSTDLKRGTSSLKVKLILDKYKKDKLNTDRFRDSIDFQFQTASSLVSDMEYIYRKLECSNVLGGLNG